MQRTYRALVQAMRPKARIVEGESAVATSDVRLLPLRGWHIVDNGALAFSATSPQDAWREAYRALGGTDELPECMVGGVCACWRDALRED